MTIAAAKTGSGTEIRRPLMLIGGDWAASGSGRTLTVENPAKRQPVAEVPRADAEDVDRAVKAAATAFPAWSKVAPRDRGRMLLRIADALEARTEELARLIALETEIGRAHVCTPVTNAHLVCRLMLETNTLHQ